MIVRSKSMMLTDGTPLEARNLSGLLQPIILVATADRVRHDIVSANDVNGQVHVRPAARQGGRGLEHETGG